MVLLFELMDISFEQINSKKIFSTTSFNLIQASKRYNQRHSSRWVISCHI